MPLQLFITGILTVSKTQTGWLNRVHITSDSLIPFKFLPPTSVQHKTFLSSAGPFVCLQNKVQQKKKFFSRGEQHFCLDKSLPFSSLKMPVIPSLGSQSLSITCYLASCSVKNICSSSSFLQRSNQDEKSIMKVLCVPSSTQSTSKIIKTGKDSVLYLALRTNPR